METSLKTGFAQIFSRCPKNLSCPKFGGAAATSPPRPVRLWPYLSNATPWPYELNLTNIVIKNNTRCFKSALQ